MLEFLRITLDIIAYYWLLEVTDDFFGELGFPYCDKNM